LESEGRRGEYYQAAVERTRTFGPRFDADERPAGKRGAGFEDYEGRRSSRERETAEPRYAYLHQEFGDESQGRYSRDLPSEDWQARPARDTQYWQGRRRHLWTQEPFVAEEVMTRNLRVLRQDDTLQQAALVMRDENCGIVPVLDERSRLVGLLTDRDMVVRAFADDRSASKTRVSEIMTRKVDAVTPRESIHDIIALMGRKQIRRIPVVAEDDRLVGIISMADIATKAQFDSELQHALDKISSRRSFWSRVFGS